MKFTLNDIEVVNGLASIKHEIDLEPLKDAIARQYIDTEIGYDLLSKANDLAKALNSIYETLRANGVYNITELNDFGDFADYTFPNERSNSKIEVNLPGILQYVVKMNSRLPA